MNITNLQVMEIRPSIKWNKGHALEYFLDTLGLSSSSNILPVYVGDDRTDEDAFKVFAKLQNYNDFPMHHPSLLGLS